MKRWLRYRWYMLVECWKLGVPLLGLIHADFHGKTDLDYMSFVHRAKWRWEYWTVPLRRNGGPFEAVTQALPMPEKYMNEMLAQSLASIATLPERWPWVEWWQHCRHNAILSPETRGFFDKYAERFQSQHSRYGRRPIDRYSRGP